MPFNIPITEKKRVVVIGAGFAGLKLCRDLVKSDYQVVLIDRNNYHQFQPLFYQVATSGLEPSAISFPLRKVFHHTRNIFVRIAEVLHVDMSQNTLHTDIGSLKYDYLVISTGVRTSFFGMENVRKYAIPMKTVAQALALRNTILTNFEQAVTHTNQEENKKLMNIVIVGGGPTGVEVSGALADLRKYVLPKDYPDLDFSQMQIYLIEASPRLLGSMSEQASIKSKKYLESLQVKVLLNERVVDYDGQFVKLNNGQTIESNTMIWAAGIHGTYPEGVDETVVGRGNRIVVDRQNRISGFENVFALGDVAYMETTKYPHGHPQVAQVAIQQANNLAKNLKRMSAGKSLFDFEYSDKGSMATVGRNLAVVDLPFWRFGGKFAWFVWMFVHLMSIVGVKNRLLIFVNWVWNYLTYDQSLRLIIRPFRKEEDQRILPKRVWSPDGESNAAK